MCQKILCVDDEPNILEGYKRALRKEFDLYSAEGGVEGLATIEANGPFAVIVSDMRMPGMDGVQFLTKVKEVAPDSVRIYDPVPHVITRRANMERAQLLVQSRSRPAMQGFLQAWSAALFEHAPRNVRWHLDVDPIDFD